MRAGLLQSGAASSDGHVVCKHCLSGNVVRNGRKGQVQYYLCRSCRRAFADTDAPPGMRYAAHPIGAALAMFYDGLSIDAIRKQLAALDGIHPSDSTVHGWIMHFTENAIGGIEASSVEVSDVWMAVETVMDREEDERVWDIVDSTTRFLLACRVSRGRTRLDVQALLMEAFLVADRLPRVIVAEGLGPYLDPDELDVRDACGHTGAGGWSIQADTNLTVRLRDVLQARVRLVGRMKNADTTRLVRDGWRAHYNFFRAQAELGGKTPGQAARTTVSYGSWEDVVRGEGVVGLPLNGTPG